MLAVKNLVATVPVRQGHLALVVVAAACLRLQILSVTATVALLPVTEDKWHVNFL